MNMHEYPTSAASGLRTGRRRKRAEELLDSLSRMGFCSQDQLAEVFFGLGFFVEASSLSSWYFAYS